MGSWSGERSTEWTYPGGTLDGVAYQGTLDLTASNSWLTITGGTTFSGAGGVGAGTINLSGNANQNSILEVLGTGTLDNATVNIGGANTWDYSEQRRHRSGGDPDARLQAHDQPDGAYAQLNSSNYAGDGIINNGTINANYAGGYFHINGVAPTIY